MQLILLSFLNMLFEYMHSRSWSQVHHWLKINIDLFAEERLRKV